MKEQQKMHEEEQEFKRRRWNVNLCRMKTNFRKSFIRKGAEEFVIKKVRI
jgi:hypothetical protein